MTRLAVYAGEGWCPTGKQWDLLMTLPCQEVPRPNPQFGADHRSFTGAASYTQLHAALCAILSALEVWCRSNRGSSDSASPRTQSLRWLGVSSFSTLAAPHSAFHGDRCKPSSLPCCASSFPRSPAPQCSAEARADRRSWGAPRRASRSSSALRVLSLPSKPSHMPSSPPAPAPTHCDALACAQVLTAGSAALSLG